MDKSAVRNTLYEIEILRQRLLRPKFIDMGLTVGQGQPRILKELRIKDGMTQRELADNCLLDVTTMSRTLDRLEQAGLIKRTNNPECRRSWIIALTDEGKKKADEAIKIFDMADEVFCTDLSDDELENLVLTAKKIQLNIEEALKQKD